MTGAWWLLVGTIGLLILGFFFAKKVRGFAVYTLPELVEKEYGSRVGLAASILIVVAWVGIVAGQIVAAGEVLSVLGLTSPTWGMLIFTIVFVVYAMLGGQYSIIRTDAIQAVILFVGIIAALAVAFHAIGGLSELKVSLPQDSFSFPVSATFGWKSLLSYLILIGATYVVGPDIYTRLFCAKDEKVAQKASFITAFLIFLLAFAIALIGMVALALYPEISAEQAFPQIIKELLPIGLNGIVLAALVAALMSSADTCVLSQSVILTEDVIKRFHPLDERKTVLLSRLNILLLGLIALALALALKGVISSLLFAYTVFTCGLVVPVIAGFYREKLRVTWQGALAAIIGGGTIGLLGRIPGIDIPLKGDLGLIGFAISAILLFGVSFLTNKRSYRKRSYRE